MLYTINDGRPLYMGVRKVRYDGIENTPSETVDLLCSRFFNAMNVIPINFRVNSSQFLDKFVNSKANIIPKKTKILASRNVKKIKSAEKTVMHISSDGVLSLANPNASKARPNMSKIRAEYFMIG